MTPTDRVTAALRAKGSRRQGVNWQFPAHHDRTPSLSVREHADGSGAVLMYCHAGCSTVEEILPALGLKASDLFPGNGQMVLFPESKYRPIGIDVLLKTPEGPHRTLHVAGALGRYVDRWGGRTYVENTKQMLCVVLEARHRKAVRDFLGISSNRLSKHIMEWREWGVAHACSRGLLTILVRDSESCPLCQTFLNPEQPASKTFPNPAHSASPTFRNRERPRHESKATTHGFYKELDGKTWETYPELKGLELLKKHAEGRRK